MFFGTPAARTFLKLSDRQRQNLTFSEAPGKDLELSNYGIVSLKRIEHPFLQKNHIIDGPSCRYISTRVLWSYLTFM